MKALLHLFLASMFMLPIGLMAQSPVGNWKTAIPDENGNMIPLKVKLSEDGTYTVDFGSDGTIEIKGKYTIDGGKMTIQDADGSECTAQGVYKFKVEGDTFTMTRISDGCPNRGGPDGVMSMQRS